MGATMCKKKNDRWVPLNGGWKIEVIAAAKCYLEYVIV
jgi:hypothetical protein